MSEAPQVLADGALVLDAPVTLPDVLDVVIVGGGPAGTAAAFRAKELGLAALVVDYDDVMKRVRDYAKDKLILPGFGGGDQMKFPKGGPLVSQLLFGAIDKDAMCVLWKGLYRTASVPARVGVELVGLEEAPDGVWRVKTWNHNTRADEVFLARHVVLAFGRGVPRRLDIPGPVEGLAFNLTDASRYVDGPVCVIGGGTSAAEAVIAISHAKVKAGDASEVYWSYRGDKMPKVSKALADVFFEAYVGNGNIRYIPKSEPTAVVTTEEVDWLCIRTDRRLLPDRPRETSHLEFIKTRCIACIGEDIPEALLASVGVRLLTGGPSNKKRMAVTPLLESERRCVYLLGDMLSPAYFEVTDFNADPSQFREVKRKGNIKAAMRDGVFVAEVIAQRIAGKASIHVELEFVDDPADAAQPPAAKRPEQPIAAGQAPRASLVLMLQGNVDADEFRFRDGDRLSIGRQGCDANFPEDASISERHATISRRDGGYVIEDHNSRSGVFLQAAEGKAIQLSPGTIVRVGRQWLLCGDSKDACAVVHYDPDGVERSRRAVTETPVVVGRESEMTLDRQDGLLSRRHVALAAKQGRLWLRDLDSVNGTFIKVDRPMSVEGGDVIVLGRRRFRLVTGRPSEPSSVVRIQDPVPSATKPAPPSASDPGGAEMPAQATPAAPAATGEPLLSFAAGPTVPVKKGQTICEVAERCGVHIIAECHRGICGSDPVRVIDGADHLSAIGDVERATLEDTCSLEPGPYRLACVARLTGAASVEILSP